jgi:hypothetical protein
VATGRSLGDLLAALEPALGARLLTEAEGGALQFVHALVREVLVEDLSVLRRRTLHLQVADALAARGLPDEAELLAEHLWASVPLAPAARTADALGSAAEVAVRRFAIPTADGLLSRALDLRRGATDDESARLELQTLIRLVSVRSALQGYAGALELLRQGQRLARRLADEHAERELLWAEWAGADVACDFARAEPLAEQLKPLMSSQDPVLRHVGAETWGIQCWHAGRLPEARDALDVAVEATDGMVHVPDDADLLLSFSAERVLLSRAFRLAVHEALEDLPTAAAELGRLQSGLDRFAGALVAVFACWAPAVRGDATSVAATSDRVVEADREGLLSFWGSQARMHHGWTRMVAGEVDDGWALWQEGRKAYGSAGLRTGNGMFLANAALALLDAGRTEVGLDLAAQAREELDLYREMWTEPLVLLAEARAASARGDDPRALLDAARAAAEVRSMAGAVRRIEAVRRTLMG